MITIPVHFLKSKNFKLPKFLPQKELKHCVVKFSAQSLTHLFLLSCNEVPYMISEDECCFRDFMFFSADHHYLRANQRWTSLNQHTLELELAAPNSGKLQQTAASSPEQLCSDWMQFLVALRNLFPALKHLWFFWLVKEKSKRSVNIAKSKKDKTTWNDDEKSILVFKTAFFFVFSRKGLKIGKK